MSNDINHDYIVDYIRGVLPDRGGVCAEIEKTVEEDYFPIVEKETAALLEVMCQALCPQAILEIGTAVGYSAILMKTATGPKTKITTIERYERAADLAVRNIERAGFAQNIEVVLGDAADILPSMNGQYDLIFLDAAKGQYPYFLQHLVRVLKPRGMLICDNVLYKGMTAENTLVIRRKKTIVKRLRMFLDAITHHEQLTTCIIPMGDGLTISIKRPEGVGGEESE